MNEYWLTRQEGERLLVFCNGWGMDHLPLQPLDTTGFDVVVLSDYRVFLLPETVEKALQSYERCDLVCWSMGVWAGQALFANLQDCFVRRIAINGTLRPIDENFGIPPQRYDATLAGFSADGQQRFYRRMCRHPRILQDFLTVRPHRSVADQQDELISLRDLVGQNEILSQPIFTDVIISDADLVMPTVNQQAFWKEKDGVISIQGPHFPFFHWSGWGQIFGLVGADD